MSDLDAAVDLLKCLADASRLRLVGLLANGEEMSVEELATGLDLSQPTVSHHLARLRAQGLVRMRKSGQLHLYRLDTDRLQDFARDIFAPERVAGLATGDGRRGFAAKVERDFFDGDRLKEIPAMRKKRRVVLHVLAREFAPGRRYREREVNDILRRHHPDVATLRREFIASRIMAREGGEYWLLPAAAREAGEA